VVKENGDPMLTIQRLDPIYAEFSVPERALPDILRHMRDGTLAVEVWVPEAPQYKKPGELTFVDNAVNQDAGTVRLRATLRNTERYFWAGQFVQVRLVLTTRKDAVLVPARALQVGQGGPYVYRVNEASAAEMRPVTVGQRLDDMFMVEGPIRPGDRVIVTGQMMVTPGGKVTVLPAPGVPATQPAEK
jgi:membrane fusion protein, multidrug efflux system